MNEKQLIEKKENVIGQLNAMDLSYEDLNKIQIFLINNNHTMLGDLVFKKQDLKDEEFIFYMEGNELWECIENGNGKIDKDYCQFYNDGIWFYTFEKAKDIILNYMLYDALWDGSKSIFEFLSSTFNVTY